MYWWILLISIVLMSLSSQNQLFSADMPQDKNTPTIDEITLFEEFFDDTNWTSRGWYDNPKMEITSSEHITESKCSCVWHWKKAGEIGILGSGEEC